jgi:hypothetical protein
MTALGNSAHENQTLSLTAAAGSVVQISLDGSATGATSGAIATWKWAGDSVPLACTSAAGGTVRNFDLYRNRSLYFPSNTGTTFSNSSLTAGNTYTYYVIVRFTDGGTVTSNTVSVPVASNICR